MFWRFGDMFWSMGGSSFDFFTQSVKMEQATKSKGGQNDPEQGTERPNKPNGSNGNNKVIKQRITKIVNEKGEVIRETIEQLEDYDKTDKKSIDELNESMKQMNQHMNEAFSNLNQAFSEMNKAFSSFSKFSK
jgi:flagellar capping protein FliD